MDLAASTRGRRLLFALLYLSEGAPIGFIWWALPTVLRAEDTELERITGFIALLVLPWTLKFLWAPLVDTLRSRWFGYRHWVVCAQFVMGATLLPLVWLDPARDLHILQWLLLGHTLAAATQDVAIDAWAINVTPVDERGTLTGSMQTGYLTGRWLFGAGLLMVIDRMGAPLVMGLLTAAVWSTALLVLFAARHEATRTAEPFSAYLGRFGRRLRDALARRNTWLGIALALLAGAGFEAVGGVAGPLMIDLGFDKAVAGQFISLNVIAMLAGVAVVYLQADRFGHANMVLSSLLLVATFIFALAGITAMAEQASDSSIWHHTTIACLVLVYLGIGMLTASSYALFMDLTDPALGGTQFSTFMGATNGCEMWAIALLGILYSSYGSYAIPFAVMAGLSLLAVPVLFMLKLGSTEPSQ